MRPARRPGGLAVGIGLLGIALATWIVAIERMDGMDAGPGTGYGALGWFLGLWTTMMAAMMLPSAVPIARTVWAASAGAGPAATAGVLASAVVYETSPLKRACLRHCFAPLHFVMHRWRPGPLGSVMLGTEHGAWCLGCRAGLMLILVALGVMSVVWMTAVAMLVFAEKVLPGGARLPGPIAVIMIGLAAWVPVAPGSVPGA
jgi:predicted metal-binding membrane protein